MARPAERGPQTPSLVGVNSLPVGGRARVALQPRDWWLASRLGLVALFGAELVALTLPFNSPAALVGSGWLTFLFSVLKGSRPALVTTIFATVVLSRRELQRGIRELRAEAPRRSGATIRWLVPHFGLLALLAVGTALRGNARTPLVQAELWLICWALLGSGAFVTWSLALLPARFWIRWWSRSRRAFLYGFSTGWVAYALGNYAQEVWWRLQGSTFWMVSMLLHLIVGRPAVLDPNESIIGTSVFSVRITPVCSGLEGMALICCFVGLYLCFYRRSLRFPQAFLLVPIGLGASWFLNSVRIASLILIGSWLPAVGLKGFHSVAGWLFFNLLACGLVWGSWRCGLFAETPRGARSAALSQSASAGVYLAPLLILIGTSMVMRALSSESGALYPVQVMAVAVVLWHYRTQLASMNWNISGAAIVLGALAFALWVALAGTRPVCYIGPSLSNLSSLGTAVWPPFWMINSMMIAPIAEELAFRGYLTRKLICSDFETVTPDRFTWVSFLGSSALFGAFSGEWVAGIAVGMVFALAVYRRGALSDAIIAHAATNGLLCACALLVAK